MRLLTLFARHGTDKYPDCHEILNRLYERRAPGLTRRTIIVDNALTGEPSPGSGRELSLIAGDNTFWEFSGWQKAVNMLGREIEAYDAVHFVTSAFGTLYTDYLDRFSEKMVEIIARRPIAAGHIDYYPYPVRYGAFVVRSWIRSSFWLINPSELIRLRALVGVEDRRHLFPGEGHDLFARESGLSPGYRQLITQWLTGAHGTGQGTSWHSRFDLAPETKGFFQDKAVAILNEQLLSARLRAQGTALLDMTYLAELIESGEALPSHPPDWRTQIRDRRIPGHDGVAGGFFERWR